MESLHQDSQTMTGNPEEPQLERGCWQNLTLIWLILDHNVYSSLPACAMDMALLSFDRDLKEGGATVSMSTCGAVEMVVGDKSSYSSE